MAWLTVRNVPDHVQRALRAQAVRHGCSRKAWVRELLARTVKPKARVRIGDALAELGRRIGLTDEDFEAFEWVRDKMPAESLEVRRVASMD